VGIAVSRKLEIIFDTVNSSRKYDNLPANQAASFVIGWEGEVTVQSHRSGRGALSGGLFRGVAGRSAAELPAS
jgi:hypothetical protein